MNRRLKACFITAQPISRISGTIALFFLIAAHPVTASPLDEQLANVAKAIETQPETAITALLQAGIAENQPARALAPARDWLRQNLPEKPALLGLAGRAAELSGDWRGAVALYRQYLEKADPESPDAGEAITAVHRLLIQNLNDSPTAYAFGCTEAARLAVNPRFRQFDRWLLDEAKARKDSAAVTTRLLATVKAGVPDDLLVALYQQDARWLLEDIRSKRYDSARFTPEFIGEVKALTTALKFDDELKLLLDWSVAVKAYNMAKNDGLEAAPPLAEAKALIDRFPSHTELVQTDWAGGHNGPHYRGEPKKYWPHEIEAKLAPIRAVMPKLSPMQQADLVQTWMSGYYAGGPQVLTTEEERAFVLASPQLVNRKCGPILNLGRERLTFADAQKLAPHIALNPSPMASLVRAFAASGDGKDYDKAMAALLGPEAWRLGLTELGGTSADQLWHLCGRPGGNPKRDEEIAKSKVLAAQISAADIKQDAPADQRMAAFKQLWDDFRSPQPKIPGVGGRLAKVLKVTPEAVKELLKDPSLEAQILARDAQGTNPRALFQEKAMTPGQVAQLEAADPKRLCKSLIDLPKEADAATTAAALAKVLDLLQQSPVRVPIQGLERLGEVSDAVFSDPKVLEQIVQLADSGYWFEAPREVGSRLVTVATSKRDPALLLPTAACLWRHTEQTANTLPKMLTFIESLLDEQPSAAATLALCGLSTIERHSQGHRWFTPETDIPRLKAVRGKASIKLGLVVIPVAADAPAFPVYQSQAAWLSGNEESAWKLLDTSWQVFLPLHRELEVSYLMWALDRVILNRDEAREEALIKALMGWSTEAACPLTPTERANIEIAYGDIALQRGQMREARELFLRTQQNKAYQDLPVRHQATLRRVRVERIAKDFEAALKILAELELEREPTIWAATRYARAEVHFDREDFDDAADDIDSILAREPDQADAKILLGKVQLKRKKLMEATEIELGANSSRQSLVPGERLKVTLNDPTLAVSGAGSAIEVVVRAKSGDEETFFLRQFGDQKTKFRGEAATALGAPSPGDGILQVIGDDEVSYAYSERFRKQMNNLDEMRGGPIRIASDAILMTSARKLLSEDEQRTADMQELMDGLKDKFKDNLAEAARGVLAARSLDASARSGNKEDFAATNTRFLSSVTKPGNPIYVRVVDPDRSRTAQIDELAVSVASASGDSVSQVTLRETGPYTGWFEGNVLSTAAQALALAANSEPGRNPNMVISALDTYPAWQPVAKAGVTPEFTVDLNDNVALGELKITAAETGGKLRIFSIQTGMNAADMTTVAVYPQNLTGIENPWRPSVTVINDTDAFHANGDRSVHDLGELMSHMERGWISQKFAQGIAQNVAGASAALPSSVPTAVKWKRRGQHDVSSVIYRFQGYFHEPAEVTRRFRLDLGHFEIPKGTHPSINHPGQFLLAIDGKPITVKSGKLEGEATLQPGIHRFEIWGTGWVNNLGFGRSVKLLTNLENTDQLVDCPDSFFDPASFPPGLLDHRNAPAKITASEDGTAFTAAFAKDSRARLIRLVLLEQDSPVPMLGKLALTTPDGKKVLPVAKDFAALNKNDTLEIIVGDKITVRYLDDRPITVNKDKHERFLSVAFTDAKVEFADIEPRFDGRAGEDKPYHETLLRFHHDAPLSLVVQDADMDTSVAPDKVKVTLASDAGGSREFDALETGDSTGIFKLVITPVTGKVTANGQLQVASGGTITARYRDAENNRPGVPTERVANIAHAAFTLPVIRLAHVQVSALDPQKLPPPQPLINGFEQVDPASRSQAPTSHEVVRPRWNIEATLLANTSAPDGGFTTVHGHPLFLDVIAPQLALGMNSTVTVFAQTETGRGLSQQKSGSRFDINVPGTIEMPAVLPHSYQPPDPRWGTPQLASYTGGTVFSNERAVIDDRFRLAIPLIAGVIPRMGVISAEERKELATGDNAAISAARTDALVVSPGEMIHLGFRFRDAAGAEQWVTATTKAITHPVFDIMTEDFRTPVTSAYVGETLNLRVVDLGADTSDQSDTVGVLVQAKSSAKRQVELRETGPHTGIFKGTCTLAYATPAAPAKPAAPADADDADAAPEPASEGIQVVYGDTLAARYTDANGLKTDTQFVTISKGADGGIRPFSKTYQDPEIAMRSQFSLAEAYLEMAKRHRLLGNLEAADLEYISAKQLLASAMDQFTDPETRAHAEYLLGSLTFEEADSTADAAMKETRYRAALARFMNVTGSYPDTVHASKAQYRLALVYEALKEPEIAAQEYVKLAYKYPDSEFIATSMARLGSHFLKTATAYEEKAKPLLAMADNKDALFEGQALQKMASNEFIKTARIFGRLQERFPDNELAGQAGLRAGQAYFRAVRHQDALTAFLRVVAEEGYDGANIRSQAMYWAGMCYQELRQPMAAYSIFKRLTYDFPESQWAAYARAQLSQENMLKLETNLELQQLEAEK